MVFFPSVFVKRRAVVVVVVVEHMVHTIDDVKNGLSFTKEHASHLMWLQIYNQSYWASGFFFLSYAGRHCVIKFITFEIRFWGSFCWYYSHHFCTKVKCYFCCCGKEGNLIEKLAKHHQHVSYERVIYRISILDEVWFPNELLSK